MIQTIPATRITRMEAGVVDGGADRPLGQGGRAAQVEDLAEDLAVAGPGVMVETEAQGG